ncbi:unnamed protein product [Alternaria alternata]
MAPSLVSAVLKGSALLAAVNAQNFAGSGRDEDAFEYVQPVNTTILTEYGSSPPVYPSPNITGAGGWEMGLEKAKAFVAQLTVEEKADMLRGFEKVYLEEGESQKVSFELQRRDLSYWDIVSQQWVIPEGEFTIWVGLSSRDLKVQDSFTVVSQ